MLLRLEEIKKSFPSGKSENQRTVLDGINLEMNRGDTIAILGPSGSGKSTLLNIIGALDIPDSGEVFINKKPLSGKNRKELTGLRNREIGYIFQLHHLLPQCTVLENVMIPTLPQSSEDKNNNFLERAHQLIRQVDLWEQKDQKPDVLSGGESQRAAVIRALINEPSILLADEPTGSLDQKNAESIISLLLKLSEQHDTALIVVTHALEIASKMQKIYDLRDGKLKIHR